LKIICILLMILLVNYNVDAKHDCDKDEKKRLKALAEKVEFTYDYELVETRGENNRVVVEPSFKITAINLHPDIKVTIMEDYFMDRYREFKDGNNTSASLGGFLAGEKVPITIYGYVANPCSGVEVYKKYIKLPYYNSFSEDERCERYPDFKYCNDLLTSPVKESIFESEFKHYIDDLNKEVVKDKEEEKKVDIVLVLEIVGGVAILITIATFVGIKWRKKNSL